MSTENNAMLEVAQNRYNELMGFIDQKRAEIAAHEHEIKALQDYLSAMGAIKKTRSRKSLNSEGKPRKYNRKKKETADGGGSA
jgi:hypothetical protein